MEFPGVLKKKKLWKFQGSVKKWWNFQGGVIKKNHVEFPPWVLVFGLGISIKVL